MATTKKPASKKAAKETKQQPAKKSAPRKSAAKKTAPKKKPAAKKAAALLPAVVAPQQEEKQPDPKPVGRPTTYNEDIANKICERISEGESLRSICREEDMPAKATVFTWLNKHKEFSDQYTRAKEEQAEVLADDIVNISDEVGQPLIIEGSAVLIDGKPVMIVDAAAVNHARLRVDARKWVASKLKPKKYGDKIEVGGPNGGAIPVQHSGSVTLTPDEAYLRMLTDPLSDDSAG